MLPIKKITKTRLAENDLIDIWLYSYTEWGESLADYPALGIKPNMSIPLAEQHQNYITYHREEVFKK